jgi:hypothetical protein
MNDKVKFAIFFAVPALLVLFAIQFVLVAGFQLLAPIGSVRWPLFGACFVLVAFGIGWLLRLGFRSRRLDIADRLGSWLLGAWGLVWLAIWLGLYVWLGGPDPTFWDVSMVMATPEVWFAFVASGFGLWLEPHRRMATH